MDVVRQVAQLFGVRYVTLIDYDGCRIIRRVEFRGGRAFARRYGFEIANVWLEDDGVTKGVSYVKRWEPYEPGVSPRWPRFAGTIDA